MTDEEDFDEASAVDESDDEDESLQNEDEDEDEDEDEFLGFDSDVPSPVKPPQKIRENPYVPPQTSDDTSTPPKYIPPSLRAPSSSESEHLSRLRRQTQGLLNRLSEANMLSILKDIEKLYRENPRQHVTSTIVDLLLSLVTDRASLMDTFMILHGGFIAALYKVIGTDFGAFVVQNFVEEFERQYTRATDVATSEMGKETSNLIALLAELYNFQVIGSNLVFDYIRMLLQELSELNTELLLKIIRSEYCPDIGIALFANSHSPKLLGLSLDKTILRL
jgi:nucleolar MIF4G domain-containing protein 1